MKAILTPLDLKRRDILMSRTRIDYKVDPLSIKIDQTKKDTRRDAWDRDYMGYYYLKEDYEPKDNKHLSNATPVLIFAFFYVAILIMIGSVK